MESNDYFGVRDELRQALMQQRKWVELPDLLHRLDEARKEGLASPQSAAMNTPQPIWVDRFTEAFLEIGATSVSRHQVECTARTLWKWLPAQDPAAVARGNLETLPRSYA